MAGAMGIDKVKEIDGEKVNLLRFICILCPINAYMRKLMGDSWSLPQSCLVASLILSAGEYIWQDGEDLESCFNLFTLPRLGFRFLYFQRWWQVRLLGVCREERPTWLCGQSRWDGQIVLPCYKTSSETFSSKL